MSQSLDWTIVIPKILFQTSPSIQPDHVVDQLRISLGQDWTYRHFTNQDIINFFEENPLDEFRNVIDKFNRLSRGPHKADLFRYYFLFLRGGVFLDADAVLKTNIDRIARQFDVFAVRSTYVRNSVFQGLIGSVARHEIIYDALKDIYEESEDVLAKNHFQIVCNLYPIWMKHTEKPRVFLYHESYFNPATAKITNEKDQIIALHFFRHKIIPRGPLRNEPCPCGSEKRYKHCHGAFM